VWMHLKLSLCFFVFFGSALPFHCELFSFNSDRINLSMSILPLQTNNPTTMKNKIMLNFPHKEIYYCLLTKKSFFCFTLVFNNLHLTTHILTFLLSKSIMQVLTNKGRMRISNIILTPSHTYLLPTNIGLT
jgi:hypothetical protein